MKDLIIYLKSDLFRYCGSIKFKKFLKQYLLGEGFRFTVWLRLCHFSKKNKYTKYTIFPFCYLFYKHYKYKYGYDISYNTEIGPGLLIFHSSGIVLAPEYIGKNATISQNCTIGMTIKNGKKYFPKIGDGLYMAPGSAIIGDVTIGNNVALGTNCVLNKSVPDNSIVVGIPGKIISNKGSKFYVNNPI